ncbi:hypothetical protein [Flavobacterium sp.]|uniref:hypothetical protein n=1 Tax=Flavobacterium sp. TaxID=239 RepID=UPI00286D7789|nr:hypothetical protein [Flavobacterium sp.]
MKYFTGIVLFIFILVQSAPSIISLFDCEKELSISMVEEEKAKEEKALKAEFVFSQNQEMLFFLRNYSNKNLSKYLIKEYQVVTSIDILPPEQV